ncbi:MAG: filamentous hemagglutinin N-terminal domain-containing protein [Pseudomonadota bacterium]
MTLHPASRELRRKLIAVLVAACYTSTHANPLAPQVVNGQAIFQRQGNLYSITNTPNTIINWQSFSIDQNEITRFIQQSADSKVLNRIQGHDPSRILGALQSNGKVFLINPNGILFGKDARIDVNGLVASSLALTNADFLAGRNRYTAGDAAGAVGNAGRITTPGGGQVYLLAPQVENSGIINSPQGDIILAAGRSVQLVDSANPDVHVVLSAPADQALNLGQAIAAGGRVGIYGALVNQRGRVSADSAVLGQDGRIVLKASGAARLEAGSSTSATNSAGRGGEIQALGRSVALEGDAALDASGAAGGGTVLIGGDYQGKNAAVQNAQQTSISAGATVRADALDRGDGGKIIAWSDQETRVYGKLSARGGARGGDGGLVETSGHYLDMQGRADTRAPQGKTGSLLLDPANVIIATDSTAAAPYFQGSGANDTTLTVATLEANLASSAVEVTASGDANSNGFITVANPLSWSVPHGLTLTATSYINLAASITAANAGLTLSSATGHIVQDQYSVMTLASLSASAPTSTVTLGGSNVISGLVSAQASGAISLASNALNLGVVNSSSGGAISASSTGNLTQNDDITSHGGSVTLSAGTGGTISAVSGKSITSGGGNVTATAHGAVALAGVSTSGGSLTVTSNDGAITQTGAFDVGAASFNAGAAAITLTNAGNSFSGAVALTNSGANNVALTSAGALEFGTSSLGSGTLSVTSGGALSQSGQIVQSSGAGAASFDAGAAPITLTNIYNNFSGAVSLNNSGTNNVAVTASGAFVFGTSSLGGGSLTVNINGPLSQSGAITRAADAGAASFTSSDDIRLTNTANSFQGAVSLNTNSAYGASVVASDALLLGASSVPNGTLTVTSGGGLTQSGALAAGALDVTANTNTLQEVLLASYANNISGAATFTNGTGTIGKLALRNTAANASYPAAVPSSVTDLTLTYNNGDITLPVLNLGGALSVTAGGALTTGNALTVGGSLALSAGSDIVQAAAWTVGGATTISAGSHAITLSNAGNSFGGAVNITNTDAHNVALSSGGALALGAVNIDTGNLTVASGGALTQTGALTVGGTLDVTMNTNTLQDVLLASYANNIGGAATFTNGTGTIGKLALRNTSATASYPTLPSSVTELTLNYDASNVILPALSLSGALNVTAGGALTQSGALSIGGATTLSAGSHAITLTNASNSFTGAVSLSNSGANNVALTSGGALALGASSLGSGSLAITSGGALTQTGALTAGGATTINAGSHAITLTNPGNNFSGAVCLNNSGANDVALTSGGALTLGGSSLGSGSLSVISGGAVGQSGALVQSVGAGAAGFTAAGAITLSNGSNDFKGSVALITPSADGASVTDTNALVLGTSAIPNGTLTVASGSAVTQTGAITAVGLGVTAQSGITLSNSANHVHHFTASNPSTGGITLVNQLSGSDELGIGPLTSGASTVIGAIGIDNIGGIYTSGALSATGGVTLTAHSPITINNIVAGSNIALTASTGISLGTSSSLNSGSAITMTAGTGIQLGGSLTAPTGISAVAQTGSITTVGSPSIASSGPITLNAVSGTVNTGSATFPGTSPQVVNGATNAAADAAAAAAAEAAAKAAADAAAKAAADAAAKAAADAAAKAAADAAAKAAADAAAKAAADAAAKAAADAAAKAAADAAAKAAADAAAEAAAKAAADAAAKAAADAAAEAAAKAAADAAAKAAADAAAKAAADAAAKAAADAAAEAAAKAAADAAAKAAADAAAKAAADAAAKAAADAAAKAAADAAAKAAADAAAKAAADAAAKAAADAAAKAAADAAAKAAADAAAKAAAEAAQEAAAKAAAEAAAAAQQAAAQAAAQEAAAKAAADKALADALAKAAADKAAADAAAKAAAEASQTKSTEPVGQAINSTVNIINASIKSKAENEIAEPKLLAKVTASTPAAQEEQKGGEAKKEEKKDGIAAKDVGIKKDDTTKKMYCN